MVCILLNPGFVHEVFLIDMQERPFGFAQHRPWPRISQNPRPSPLPGDDLFPYFGNH
jgi:hypothetical protein